MIRNNLYHSSSGIERFPKAVKPVLLLAVPLTQKTDTNLDS